MTVRTYDPSVIPSFLCILHYIANKESDQGTYIFSFLILKLGSPYSPLWLQYSLTKINATCFANYNIICCAIENITCSYFDMWGWYEFRSYKYVIVNMKLPLLITLPGHFHLDKSIYTVTDEGDFSIGKKRKFRKESSHDINFIETLDK